MTTQTLHLDHSQRAYDGLWLVWRRMGVMYRDAGGHYRTIYSPWQIIEIFDEEPQAIGYAKWYQQEYHSQRSSKTSNAVPLFTPNNGPSQEH